MTYRRLEEYLLRQFIMWNAILPASVVQGNIMMQSFIYVSD